MRAFARPALQAVDTRARKSDRHGNTSAWLRQARGYPMSPAGRPKGRIPPPLGQRSGEAASVGGSYKPARDSRTLRLFAWNIVVESLLWNTPRRLFAFAS